VTEKKVNGNKRREEKRKSHKPGKRQCMGRAKTSTSVSSSIHALPVPRLHLSLLPLPTIPVYVPSPFIVLPYHASYCHQN